ncbi:hypothetical protein LCGC14_0601790 [marine sediment metagenome]|uniref:Uncharacterized protein n=1 Tax=marine sediment metagenome TaxID=412755 RepID=A0A0F9RUB1_9ZZZZ|nr:hypothetical protein [Pricia sp.]
MDLYCDHPDCTGIRLQKGFVYYTGEPNKTIIADDRATAYKKARALGWELDIKAERDPKFQLGTGRVLCPKHSKKKGDQQ